MKQLIFIAAIIFFTSCGAGGDSNRTPEKITYDITYTDGTHETVTLKNEIAFGSGDCVETCGCGGEPFKRCGVRKFDKVTTPVVVKATPKKEVPVAKNTVVKKPHTFKN